MPDFVPAALLKYFLAIDRWLENSRLRPYSVHYMAVLERDSEWAPAMVEPTRPHLAHRMDARWSTVKE